MFPHRVASVAATHIFRRCYSSKSLCSLDFKKRLGEITWKAAAKKPPSPGSQLKSIACGTETAVTSQYPFVWLRDSCQCPQCYHPTTKSRITTLNQLRNNTTPVHISMDDTSETVSIEWTDGHQSRHSYRFLQDRIFGEKLKNWSSTWETVAVPELWGPPEMDASGGLPRVKFHEVINNKDMRTLSHLLRILLTKGVCIVEDVPCNTEATDEFVKQLSFHDTTSYGPYFDVISKENPSNLAYTSSELGLHTDLPYYTHPPGVQGLHCIVRDSSIRGGENTLTDGFHVAQLLRQRNPQHFHLLTTEKILFRDFGRDYLPDYHFLRRQTIISLNDDGKFRCIHFNNHVRDTVLPITLDKVEDYYEAMMHFSDIAYEQAVRHLLLPGELLLFNNQRVLHGRERFYAAEGHTERHLRGFYLRWDELLARARRLLDGAL